MITVDKETRKFEFYKKHEGDKIWWVDYFGCCGLQAVSFDKKRYYISLETIQKNFQRKKRLCLIKRILIGQICLMIKTVLLVNCIEETY